MRTLDAYDTVLLDMNHTFMFGHDRIGPDQNYYETYQQLGFSRLDEAQVFSAIEQCRLGLDAMYSDTGFYDAFPTFAEALELYEALQPEDVLNLAAVFAEHECGTVPAHHALFLTSLSTTHRLGIVSNLWSLPGRCRVELERAQIHDIWQVQVFSSEATSIKPSPTIFERAMKQCETDPGRILFVGDSLDRDIQPAHALGMGTVWIGGNAQSSKRPGHAAASILDLWTLSGLAR